MEFMTEPLVAATLASTALVRRLVLRTTAKYNRRCRPTSYRDDMCRLMGSRSGVSPTVFYFSNTQQTINLILLTYLTFKKVLSILNNNNFTFCLNWRLKFLIIVVTLLTTYIILLILSNNR